MTMSGLMVFMMSLIFSGLLLKPTNFLSFQLPSISCRLTTCSMENLDDDVLVDSFLSFFDDSLDLDSFYFFISRASNYFFICYSSSFIFSSYSTSLLLSLYSSILYVLSHYFSFILISLRTVFLPIFLLS